MLTRRGFLAESTLAAVAALLAACGDGQLGPTITPDAATTDSNTLRLSDYPALAVVAGVTFIRMRTVSLALVRAGEAEFVALARACPHQGPLVDASSSGFTCPRHGARFSLAGQFVGGPAATVKTFKGLPQRNMRSYPVQYDRAAGTLTIGI